VQVIFAVSDLGRSLAFYETAFDWPRNPRIDYSNYVELFPSDGGTLGLFERVGFAGTVGAEPIRLENGDVAPDMSMPVWTTSTRRSRALPRPVAGR
jgi:hypothetical protein